MVETIQIQKYRSKDGNTYDTEQQAIRADKAWSLQYEVDVDKEIRQLEGEQARVARHHAKFQNPWPKLIVQKGKHGDAYYAASNEQGYNDIFWEIFTEQMADYGFYQYFEKDTRDALVSQRIQETQNKAAAQSFVLERTEYEYEGIEIERITFYG